MRLVLCVYEDALGQEWVKESAVCGWRLVFLLLWRLFFLKRHLVAIMTAFSFVRVALQHLCNMLQ